RVADGRALLPVNRIVRDGVVDAGHDILPVLRPPGAPRAPEKFLSVARRAAEVHLEHEVAVRGEILILEIESVFVRRVRPAVVADDERIRSAVGAVAVRVHQPSFYRSAVGTREVEAVRLAERDFAREVVEDVAELHLAASVELGRENLGRRLERADEIGHSRLSAIEAETA